MSSRTLYRATASNTWRHLTLPDVIPGGTVDPDPDPNPVDPELWYGTTLFGQSFANYKKHAISGVNDRLKQVEYDTVYGGNRGGACSRIFGSGMMETFDNMLSGAHRAGQPVCYSFKDGPGVDNSSESVFKGRFRDWLDAGNAKNPKRRVWLVFHHEFDNDGNMTDGNNQTGQMGNWYDRNIWLREVLEETAYKGMAARNGGWVKTGFITVGKVFHQKNSPTANDGFQTYCENIMTRAGTSNLGDIWDFGGMDRYNPSWESGSYVTVPDYLLRPTQFHSRYGLQFVVGESGSPRVLNNQTTAQRNASRASWLDDLYGALRDTGWVDAVFYWRVPSNSNPLNAWSTNMVTPTGYNGSFSAYAGSQAAGNGGFDDQLTSDVISEYCVTSIQQANALNKGPNIPYYTGGPA